MKTKDVAVDRSGKGQSMVKGGDVGRGLGIVFRQVPDHFAAGHLGEGRLGH